VQLNRTMAEVEAQSTISVNEERMQRISGTEDALEAEAFQQQNMEFVRKIRAQNARISMALSAFTQNITSILDSEASIPTGVQEKLRSSINIFNKKMRYRLKDVRGTLKADTHATKTRLGRVDTQIKKLLKKQTPHHRLTHGQKVLRRQKQIKAWKSKTLAGKKKQKKNAAEINAHTLTASTASGKSKEVLVKLPSFAEFKKQKQEESAVKNSNNSAKSTNTEAEGSKRMEMEKKHRAVQARLARVFSMAHDLPSVKVSLSLEAKWKALLEEYREQLQKDVSDQSVAAKLSQLSTQMSRVLRSPNGRRDLLTMFRSRMFKPVMEENESIDAAYVERQINMHPYRTFQHLMKLLGFTKGKPKVLEIEAKLTNNKIDDFEAWGELRQLMNTKQTPRIRPNYQKPKN